MDRLSGPRRNLTDLLGIDPRRSQPAGEGPGESAGHAGAHIGSVGAAEAFAPRPATVVAEPLEVVPKALWALAPSGFLVALPTLIVNAVSQDGEAPFPLIMLHRRVGAVGSALTTLPARVVASVVLYLG